MAEIRGQPGGRSRGRADRVHAPFDAVISVTGPAWRRTARPQQSGSPLVRSFAAGSLIRSWLSHTPTRGLPARLWLPARKTASTERDDRGGDRLPTLPTDHLGDVAASVQSPFAATFAAVPWYPGRAPLRHSVNRVNFTDVITLIFGSVFGGVGGCASWRGGRGRTEWMWGRGCAVWIGTKWGVTHTTPRRSNEREGERTGGRSEGRGIEREWERTGG